MMRVAPWNPRPEPTLWGPYREGLTLRDVLEAARRDDAARVMLTGPVPSREWLMQRAEGWHMLRVFHDHETPAARYRHAVTGHTLELRRAAEWFGAGDYSHTTARAAWDALGRILARSGRVGGSLMRSPGATGTNLWLSMAGGDVPDPLPDDVQQEIRATTAQHRIELVPPAQPTMPGMWVIDGRVMYAALLRELGVGPARRMTAAEATEHAHDEYARARYRVKFRAPSFWRELGHVGLILAPAGPHHSDGWHAPLDGEAWVDAAELQLARRWEWSVEILEGIAYDKGRPLDAWGARLMRARDAATDDALGADVAPLVRSALRSILLHAIGSFHSAGRDEQAVTESPMTPPPGDGWEPPERLEDGRAVWRRPAPEPTARQLAGRHPEWSAGVWGRAHARILESPTAERGRHGGALYVPPASLVSIYGDAIMTTMLPDWAALDDGKPGRLRVKGHLCAPAAWPATARERDELVRAADAAGTGCNGGCTR